MTEILDDLLPFFTAKETDRTPTPRVKNRILRVTEPLSIQINFGNSKFEFHKSALSVVDLLRSVFELQVKQSTNVRCITVLAKWAWPPSTRLRHLWRIWSYPHIAGRCSKSEYSSMPSVYSSHNMGLNRIGSFPASLRLPFQTVLGKPRWFKALWV